jgi:ketosteroid isomerase-like protein
MTESIREAVDRFRRGWESLDTDAVLATFSRDPSVLVWGTDADEEWRGFDALVEPFRRQMESFTEPRYSWAEAPVVWSAGDMGCVAGILHVSLRAGDEAVSVLMRSTFVLSRDPAGWNIVHAHFSVGQAERVASYG